METILGLVLVIAPVAMMMMRRFRLLLVMVMAPMSIMLKMVLMSMVMVTKKRMRVRGLILGEELPKVTMVMMMCHCWYHHNLDHPNATTCSPNSKNPHCKSLSEDP